VPVILALRMQGRRTTIPVQSGLSSETLSQKNNKKGKERNRHQDTNRKKQGRKQIIISILQIRKLKFNQVK
jgi:hypothetical protein